MVVRARVFFLLIVTLVYSLCASARTVVSVAVDHAPPYSNTESSTPKGLIIDILRPIAQELNFDINVIACPFSRCVYLLTHNEADIMGELIRTPAREQQLQFVTPAYMALHSSFSFYSLKTPSFNIERYNDLYGKRIAVMRGAAHFARFDNDEKLIKVPVTSEQIALDMLLKDRVDLFIGVEATAEHAMGVLQRPAHQLMKHPYRYQDAIYGHMAFASRFAGSTLAEKINQQYQKMLNSGELSALVKPYALPPVMPQNGIN